MPIIASIRRVVLQKTDSCLRSELNELKGIPKGYRVSAAIATKFESLARENTRLQKDNEMRLKTTEYLREIVTEITSRLKEVHADKNRLQLNEAVLLLSKDYANAKKIGPPPTRENCPRFPIIVFPVTTRFEIPE